MMRIVASQLSGLGKPPMRAVRAWSNANGVTPAKPAREGGGIAWRRPNAEARKLLFGQPGLFQFPGCNACGLAASEPSPIIDCPYHENARAA